MKELVGKTITALYLDNQLSDDRLIFETDQGQLVWDTYSDCCSETWFADIVGVFALIGGTVTEVSEVSLEVLTPHQLDESRTRQDYDSIYGYKLKTDKGYADIIFRNSSNGYYGGSCFINTNAPHVDTSTLKQITDDWSA